MLQLLTHKFTKDQAQASDYCQQIKASDTATLIYDDVAERFYRYGYVHADAAAQAKFNLENCKDPDDIEQFYREYYVKSVDGIVITSLPISEFS